MHVRRPSRASRVTRFASRAWRAARTPTARRASPHTGRRRSTFRTPGSAWTTSPTTPSRTVRRRLVDLTQAPTESRPEISAPAAIANLKSASHPRPGFVLRPLTTGYGAFCYADAASCSTGSNSCNSAQPCAVVREWRLRVRVSVVTSMRPPRLVNPSHIVPTWVSTGLHGLLARSGGQHAQRAWQRSACDVLRRRHTDWRFPCWKRRALLRNSRRVPRRAESVCGILPPVHGFQNLHNGTGARLGLLHPLISKVALPRSVGIAPF